MRVMVADNDLMYRFPPTNWSLIQLFDGNRSYEEIAEAYSAQTGHEYSTEDVHNFADMLEELNFWYKSPQEKNIQLMQKSAEERRKLLKSRKSRFGDLAEIAFPAVNPDPFVTWLYKYTSFVYTWWFSAITVITFGISISISVAHWDEIWRDTLEFFSFTNKSFSDVAVFYVLAMLTMCWHELAHAHACKHYGGRVRAMGFMLIYLTPAFFTDTSEGFVVASRHQRFIIAMAGAWSELYICAVATPIWWGTPPGSSVHNVAYLLMLMSGIVGLFLNWNPLMKLDGYYMLSEALGIADLKENSTAYVSAWVKRHIWRLPVEVPYVPKKRRLGFAVYAILSGAYSYTVLYILARFVGNIFRNFNPEWSFIPELGTAGLIFRSRIRSLVNFMKFVYLDKKDRIRALFGSPAGLGIAALVAAILLIPIWRESVDARFILEPETTVVVRNLVPGTITEIWAKEGVKVSAGAPLVRLRDVSLESRVAGAEADLAVVSAQVKVAALRYEGFGTALKEREQLAKQSGELRAEGNLLSVDSPIGGIVLTSRPEDRLGEYVPAGTELLKVGRVESMRAHVYVSDYDMYKLRIGAPATVQVDGFASLWTASAVSITPVSSALPPGIAEKTKYQGLNPLNFYVADIVISNPQGILKPGMVGTARIYGQRRNLLGHFARETARFFGRKVW